MLKGVCGVGSGKITGRVQIVNEPVENCLSAGKIMVTPKTCAQSIPDMKRALAVVTDHGARTSHAMIVCRDNNIPCIVGTGFATKELRDGDNVILNLDDKTIEVIADGRR